MQSRDIEAQLGEIVGARNFPEASNELVGLWKELNVGREALVPVLRFMEEHPGLDFGQPGSLVHFLEDMDLESFTRELVASIERRPTPHTLWMIHRIANAVDDPREERRLMEIIARARQHPLADDEVMSSVDAFVGELEE
ncbi:MAG: hypothetical protein QM767_04760 [Anaeromyxobacter sp.]